MSMNDDIRKIVVVNVPYGKFQLPEEAFKDYKEVSNQPDLIDCRLIRRDDKNLVWIVEELIAEGNFNQLKIVKIPPTLNGMLYVTMTALSMFMNTTTHGDDL